MKSSSTWVMVLRSAVLRAAPSPCRAPAMSRLVSSTCVHAYTDDPTILEDQSRRQQCVGSIRVCTTVDYSAMFALHCLPTGNVNCISASKPCTDNLCMQPLDAAAMCGAMTRHLVGLLRPVRQLPRRCTGQARLEMGAPKASVPWLPIGLAIAGAHVHLHQAAAAAAARCQQFQLLLGPASTGDASGCDWATNFHKFSQSPDTRGRSCMPNKI